MCSSGLISLYMAHLPRRSGKFFPSDDPSLSLLASFGVFSIGYLMRPLGGLLFGTLGDRLGRRSMLVSSVLLMVLASLAIGLLPGYSRLGVASAWLLTLLRMLQGLSVGGEFAGSITYVVESAPQEKRGRHASFAAAGAVVGFVFGSLVAALVEACLPPTAVNAWGWRLPFLFGSALGGLTLWLRSDLEDTRPEASSQDRPRQGLLRQLRNDGPLILRVVGALAFTTVSYNLVFLYWVQRAIEMHPSRGGGIQCHHMFGRGPWRNSHPLGWSLCRSLGAAFDDAPLEPAAFGLSGTGHAATGPSHCAEHGCWTTVGMPAIDAD